jgi:quinolinate synthase
MEELKPKLKNGHIDMPIPEGIDLVAEIAKLKKEKNAVILAHYYTTAEVQAIADYTGDSLGLSQQAAKTDADIILFAGVHFMAETAKVLSPNKKVLIPDLATSCSLADSVNEKTLAEFIKQHPGHTVISYVNTTAEVKALTDIVVTSSNAVKIVSQLPKDEKIIFGPDRNLGNYVKKVTGRDNMLIWDGGCHVHSHFDANKLKELKLQHPDAKVLAHPECPEAILQQADVIGATSALLKASYELPDTEFIVATEPGIFYEMERRSPNKTFIPVPNENGRALNICANMKRNNLKNIYLTLKYEFPEVDVPTALTEKAGVCITRMMEMSK